eukprot:4807576-Prymnesium_polylepis.1
MSGDTWPRPGTVSLPPGQLGAVASSHPEGWRVHGTTAHVLHERPHDGIGGTGVSGRRRATAQWAAVGVPGQPVRDGRA